VQVIKNALESFLLLSNTWLIMHVKESIQSHKLILYQIEKNTLKERSTYLLSSECT